MSRLPPDGPTGGAPTTSTSLPARRLPRAPAYANRFFWTWFSMTLAALALMLSWTNTWQRTTAERHLLELNALAQQRSVAVILSENLKQVMDRGRLLALSADDWSAGSREQAMARLTNQLTADQLFVRAALYSPALVLQFQSSPGAPGDPSPIAIEQAAARLRAGATHDVQTIARPAHMADQWTLPLLFPVPDRNGYLNGFLMLYLDVGYLLHLYRDVELGDTGAIQLLDLDHTVLAEVRSAGMSTQQGVQQLIGPGTALPDEGHQVLDATGRGDRQLLAHRLTSRAPIRVLVSRSIAEISADHAQFTQRMWVTLGVLTTVVLTAAVLLLQGLRRQQGLIKALSQTDHDKQELITQLEDEKARALMLASLDHLTGLNNRRMFNELAASHLAAARRSRKHYALVYMDLDRFKLINDSLGHHVGDLLLQAVATRLKNHVRSGDILGRMGGDEFALLVTGMDNATDIDVIATKLMAELSRTYTRLEGHDLHVTPSMGIAFFPRDGHDIATLCRHADSAMYTSKRAGRGRYSYYDPALNPAGSRHYDLERQLPRAIQEGELVLHFQPKVRLSDMRIVGLEALVRWQHPAFGLVYPGDFIPIAEQAGLIAALGEWVMAACCAQQAAWKAQGVDTVPLALNVSPQQLREPNLPAHIAQLLHQHGLTPADIEIEITESCLVEPVELAASVLCQLEGMGLRIALDDFGTGFSSLGQIRQLPIHKLKIDRSFINDLRSSNDVGVIVTSIITLAHNLQMQVVAEGVELMDQLVYLKTAGCDEVQGYFLGRPQAATDTGRLLQQRHIHPV